MRIDAHQHFWQLGKFDYVWLGPKLGILQADYGPDDLEPNLQNYHLDGSILVQTVSSLDETKWFLQLAEEKSFIRGVIGWVDLTSRDVGEVLDELGTHPRFVGIRHQVHDEVDDQWLIRDEVMRGLGELAKRNIPYELLIRPEHLGVSLKMAKILDGLPLVVDHIAKPAIAEGQWDDWANGIKGLAGCHTVSCKLSGMITEADNEHWKPKDLRPYVKHVVDSFGPERCMFGSDWPVCLLAGSYDQVVEALNRCLEGYSSLEIDAIFGNTAARIYRLEKTK